MTRLSGSVSSGLLAGEGPLSPAPSYQTSRTGSSALPQLGDRRLNTTLSSKPSNAAALAAQQAQAAQRQADAYLSELLSYSLDRLRKEPELLKEEKQQVERNILSTSVSNYGAFIEASRCLQTIDKELSSVCSNLDELLQAIPQLTSSCESFSVQSAEVMELHGQNKQLASGQSALLELLEVPQLMDTCVRNGVYDEALDLQAFVARLGLLHPDVPLVKMLLAQVAEVGQTMLQQLLARLRSNVQLPECLRVMGYLRRIAAFSEAELRLQFLQCRDEWVSGLVDELDSEGDSYEYLKHLTDVHRLHLFDAVMQYRAIFFDAPSQDNAAAISASAAATGSAAASAAAQQQQGVRETSTLHSWVQHRLGLYLTALNTHLPNITEGSNLASVLEHCMYCGSSLSRVGLDFQGLLQPPFEACALRLFGQHLSAAVEAFNGRLESHKWVPMPAQALARHQRAGSTATPAAPAAKEGSDGGAGPSQDDPAGGAAPRTSMSGGPAAAAGTPAAGSEDLSPPYVLMEHFPLAVFVNAVLLALNELRHCTLLGLARPAAGLLQQSMEHVAASLMHYRHTHVLAESDLQLFKAAARAAQDVVLPYLTNCFARVFPGGGSKLELTGASSLLKSVLADA